jgi:hypothetical protein
MQPEILNDSFSKKLCSLASRPDVHTILEIGSGVGNGSTMALSAGIQSGRTDQTLRCLEADPERFAQILDLLEKTKIQIDWFGRGGHAPWLLGTPEEWAKKGLRYHGWLEEEQLIQKLAEYPFVLLPSGEMDASDDKLSFSKLSLPSRLIFLNARVGVPVLVLGHPETAAARFVRRWGTGISSPSRPGPFLEAMSQLHDSKFRDPLLANLENNASRWGHDNPGNAIWEALEGKTEALKNLTMF